MVCNSQKKRSQGVKVINMNMEESNEVELSCRNRGIWRYDARTGDSGEFGEWVNVNEEARARDMS